MAPPVHNADGHDETSIRDILRELMGEVKGIRSDLHKQGEAIEKFWKWKTGGEEPHRGVDIRMDRLEQSAKVQSRITWGTVSTLGVLIATKAWDVLTGRSV